QGVQPIVHADYSGDTLTLPRLGTRLDPASMPALAAKRGHDIVTSSGDTLLGADDKAGVAEIVVAVAHLAAHPELPRPTLRVAFTPDEEIGEGATLFDIERFGAQCAYTLDGSGLGGLDDETFSPTRSSPRFTASTCTRGTRPANWSAHCAWPPRSWPSFPPTG
ncbi:MAG TPA: M20/M25/M40 family metallo-hydrolase, partial [Solirubrobacteraceae bacterium]|nr:M20/M25/M40 family metallo-hydrolase [Solirubrobacteraceae bacterium]